MTATSVNDQPAPASDDESMLGLSRISVRFGGINALSELSFEARKGEVLGIIGPNGAGKTTLFDVIAGVRAPNEGRVVLAGRDITSTSSTARARDGLRRTFQRVQTFGWLTVEENVLAALEWRGGGGGFVADMVSFPTRRRRERARRERVDEVLEHCGLVPVRHEMAGSLPIGVARMVELARAIVDEPKVLLLDEPASGLDETETVRLGEQIQSVRAEHRVHDPARRAQRGVRDAAVRPGGRPQPRSAPGRGPALRGAGEPGRARRLPRRDPRQRHRHPHLGDDE